MTVSVEPRSTATSRRALLAGALGGLGAWAASAIGRANPVRAEGEAMVVGGDYTDATSQTTLANTANNANVFQATSSGGGIGVYGASSSSVGLYGVSDSNIAVWGHSEATNIAACAARSFGHSTGVEGYSGEGSLPPPKANTGVYGYAAQDNTANGVFGESPAGRAIVGYSSSGYAGYFSGRVYTSKWLEISEISTPASPSADRARLFVRDSGGKTQLAVKFPNGTVRVLATEA